MQTACSINGYVAETNDGGKFTQNRIFAIMTDRLRTLCIREIRIVFFGNKQFKQLNLPLEIGGFECIYNSIYSTERAK